MEFSDSSSERQAFARIESDLKWLSERDAHPFGEAYRDFVEAQETYSTNIADNAMAMREGTQSVSEEALYQFDVEYIASITHVAETVGGMHVSDQEKIQLLAGLESSILTDRTVLFATLLGEDYSEADVLDGGTLVEEFESDLEEMDNLEVVIQNYVEHATEDITDARQDFLKKIELKSARDAYLDLIAECRNDPSVPYDMTLPVMVNNYGKTLYRVMSWLSEQDDFTSDQIAHSIASLIVADEEQLRHGMNDIANGDFADDIDENDFDDVKNDVMESFEQTGSWEKVLQSISDAHKQELLYCAQMILRGTPDVSKFVYRSETDNTLANKARRGAIEIGKTALGVAGGIVLANFINKRFGK